MKTENKKVTIRITTENNKLCADTFAIYEALDIPSQQFDYLDWYRVTTENANIDSDASIYTHRTEGTQKVYFYALPIRDAIKLAMSEGGIRSEEIIKQLRTIEKALTTGIEIEIKPEAQLWKETKTFNKF